MASTTERGDFGRIDEATPNNRVGVQIFLTDQVDYRSQPQPFSRIVTEKPNFVGEGSEHLAYDVSDAQARYRRLNEHLTPQEIKRLAQLDEIEAVVSHVAEIEGVEVAPYSLSIVEGRLASAKLIQSDSRGQHDLAGDDGQILVVRFLSDMLASRIHKHPEDLRAQAVYRAFIRTIEPMAVSLSTGDALVFCSPPDSHGTDEYKYGFIYILTKQHNDYLHLDELSGLAVKVDFEIEEYAQLLKRNWLRQIEPAVLEVEPTYADIVAEPLVFPNVAFANAGELIDSVLRTVPSFEAGVFINGRMVDDVQLWIEKEQCRYEAIRARVETNAFTYIEALVGGQERIARAKLLQIQEESLSFSNPQLWELAVAEAGRVGRLTLQLPCGVIHIERTNGVSFSDSLSMMLRGIDGDHSDFEGENESYSYDRWTYCIVHNSKEDPEIGKSWCGPCAICKPCDWEIKSRRYRND